MTRRAGPRAVAILLLAAQSAVAQPAGWPASSFNPQADPGDLVLPMPCGGAMAFRPVQVPTDQGPIADVIVPLGKTDSAPDEFNDGAHGAFLAAPFTNPAGLQIYWIGKYTVTVAQYNAVAGHCPLGEALSPLPKTNVSWFDAVQFTQALSSWLLLHDPKALPERGDSKGFIRLPTEVEWEYAARGGRAVPSSVYQQDTWAPRGEMADYAVAGESFTSGGASPIGSRKPNPLQIYDMLGNVGQWILDPYSFVHVGRLSGLTGGFIVRGGSYMTPLSTLSSAMRQEVLPFDPSTGNATKLASVGFRVVIGVTTGDDAQRATDMRASLLALAQSRVDPIKQPLAALPELQQDTADPTVSAGLQAVGSALAKAADTTLHAEIEAALSLAFVIHERQAALTYLETMRDSPDYASLRQTSNYQGLVKNVASTQDVVDRLVDSYASLMRSITDTASRQTIDRDVRAEHDSFAAQADSRQAFSQVTQALLDQESSGTFIGNAEILSSIEDVR